MNMGIIKNDMASITKNNLVTIEACRYCPMCRQACPSEFISCRESDTPRGRAMLLHSVYKAGKEYDEATIEAIFNCFVCGSCMSWCLGFEEGGYNIPELIKFARKDIVQRGKAPKIIEAIKTSLLDKDNPYNIEKSASFSNTIVNKKIDVLYYLGADINFRNSEIAEALIKIFSKLKIPSGLLKNEPSSGKILDLLGYHNDAMGKAKHLYQRILDSGCKILIVSDPLDYDAFKNDYPEWGFKFDPDIKILHLTEYLADFVKSGSLKLGKTIERVTLADSEFLGRFNNVFEAPREIIISAVGVNFVEMQWNHKELQSTGEAAFTFNNQIFTQGTNLGEKISIMAKNIHARRIITLSAAAKNNIGKGIDVEAIHIAEFIAELM